MRYEPIPSKLFSYRRKFFAQKMVPGSIALFFSNDPMPRNGDQFFPFRQDSQLFALSGLDQPGAILVLYRGQKSKSFKEMAFILKNDGKHALWSGDRYSIKDARTISGITNIRTIDAWDSILPDLLLPASKIYINTPNHDQFHTEVTSQGERRAKQLKKLYRGHQFIPAHSIFREMAMIKHPLEIKMLKHAIDVTGYAFDRILRTIRPGMKEFEAEAELTYVLAKNGCQHAFEPIVASGKSACILHYVRNTQKIKSDSLVLLDFGAEYAYMASDMTRTIPSSGKFSKRQRNVYSSVLKVLNEVTAMMRPGIMLDQLNAEAGKLIESELIDLKIISRGEVRKQDKKAPLWKKYFMHGISHHLGYDVHDISDKSTPLKSGMVLTCEPGIYLPAENLGIRLENDILITGKNPENLMESIPIDPDEIEMIMHESTR